MNQNKSLKIDDENLRLLYQVTINDIRYAKRQQWAITYYGLLLIGAVVGFYKSMSTNGLTPVEQSVLIALCLLISFAGTISLIIFQKDLVNKRKILIRISENFSEDINRIIGEIPKDYTSFKYYFWNLILPFILVLWVGSIVVIWLIIN